MTLYAFETGHLQTRHLGRLFGFEWTELEDFSGDRVNVVKAVGLEHHALPEGRIEIDVRDVTEDEREELRAALRKTPILSGWVRIYRPPTTRPGEDLGRGPGGEPNTMTP